MREISFNTTYITNFFWNGARIKSRLSYITIFEVLGTEMLISYDKPQLEIVEMTGHEHDDSGN